MNWNMRSFNFLIAACLFSICGSAQSASDCFQRSPYLFEHFINGSVLLKSGVLEQAPLNYNADKQSIVFKKDNQDYDLTGLETIDTVYIETRKFVPVRSQFFEVLQSAPVELYATYTSKKQPVAATAEHDRLLRKEDREISNDVSNMYVTRQYRGDFAIEFHKQYWLKQYQNFYKVNTEKQVLKLFPKKEQAIRTFIKENKTDFANEADLMKLLAFCSNQS
jgi:hypothetical protein